jgi:hypothetical protein
MHEVHRGSLLSNVHLAQQLFVNGCFYEINWIRANTACTWPHSIQPAAV